MNLRWRLLAAALAAAAGGGAAPAAAEAIAPVPVNPATVASCTLSRVDADTANVVMTFQNEAALWVDHACWLQTGARVGDGGEVDGSRTTCVATSPGGGIDNRCTIPISFVPPNGDLRYCVELAWGDAYQSRYYANCTRVIRDETFDKLGLIAGITLRLASGSGRPVVSAGSPVLRAIRDAVARPTGIAAIDESVNAGSGFARRTVRTVEDLLGLEEGS